MNEMIAPCMNCDDRHAACHGDCERYAEYKAYRESIKEKKRKEVEVGKIIIDSIEDKKRISRKQYKGR